MTTVPIPEDDFREQVERLKREELYKFPVVCTACQQEFNSKEDINHLEDCEPKIRHLMPVALVEHLREIQASEQNR